MGESTVEEMDRDKVVRAADADRTTRLLSNFSDRDALHKAWLAGVPVQNVPRARTLSGREESPRGGDTRRVEAYEASRNLLPADVTAFPERRQATTAGLSAFPERYFDRPAFYAAQEAAMLRPLGGHELQGEDGPTPSADRAAAHAWKVGLSHFAEAQPQFVAENNAAVATELHRWMEGGAGARAGHGVVANPATGEGYRSRCDTAMVVHKATARYATPGGGALCNQNLTAARSLFEKAAAMHPLNYTYARAKAAASLQEPLGNRAGALKYALDCSKQADELAVLPSMSSRRGASGRPRVHV